MNPTPVEIVERIARSHDRQRAYVFFLFFSRFEYALKRAGFVRKLQSGAAEADWDAFARSAPDVLSQSADERVQVAVHYLTVAPPKKQVISGGRLSWENANHKGDIDFIRVLVLVRRIRNNLFHGGKFPGGPESDLSRDAKLLDAGVMVMQACLDSSRRLRDYFLEDFA